ncbi:conserved hypothetical protein [Methanohalobium evestigatum Z-7303]|uniref:Peptidase C39-like domain-containing protein n=1 Tax=Methanohalobium evestigatum (strain ATCC BAA-1072 / DSM 3721 / NBRC 107634 / OCM 161 / Z-7303) TaxID=644295 RepID=D7E932_METEZ|nr:C39 family peptidase [Methanohalobium evestigatum]ADI73980.1 conserved hypothetical protein [Methanohalobium evestigatum Z-7303]
MKAKFSTLLMVMVLISMAFVSTASAQNNISNETQYSDKTDNISLEKARLVASYYVQYVPNVTEKVEKFQDWNDATVKKSEIFYNLKGEKSAYAFNVTVNGEYSGYILISATKDNYPVLEFSKGKIPSTIPKIKNKTESLVKEHVNKDNLTIGKAKPLYLGATFYYAQYPLKNKQGKVVNNVTVDLTTPAIVKSNKSKIKKPVIEINSSRQQKMKKEEAHRQWKSIEKRMSTGLSLSKAKVSSSELGWIDGVPAYEWYKGCSPTASAMVLGYWKNNGYPGFPEEITLIEELANAMGTSNWPEGTTWPIEIDNGIEEVCDNHGYNNFDANNDYYVSWNEVINNVNSDEPFVINMLSGGTGSGHSQPYGEHSVTCVGYSDNTEDYIFIHDTWDENTHHIAFGNWGGAMATWVNP